MRNQELAMKGHRGMWRCGLMAWIMVMMSGHAHGQWVTQTNALKAGWNAVYLHVDASYAPISDVMASAPDIEEIWLWNPPVAGQQFAESPQVPTSTGSRWTRWTSALGPTSPLKRLVPNAAYYVKVKDAVATLSWRLKGKPVPPSYAWTSSGLNFVGFPLAQQLSYERFFLPAPQLMQGTEIYVSPGGAFGTGNPLRVYDLARTMLQRGEAVWMRVDSGFNRYFGPFEVSVSNPKGIDFGTNLAQVGFRIRNKSPETNIIRMTWHRSEVPPSGQAIVPALPPLLVRGEREYGTLARYTGIPLVDSDDLLASDPDAATGMEWSLPPAGQPGADIQVIIGLARSRITEEPGTVLAGVLRLKDSVGLIRVELPVSAVVESKGGLWVGDAKLTQVTQYLKEYARTGSGTPRVGQRWTSTSVDTFTGGDAGEGLDLEGTFPYAVNVGEAAAATVGSVGFKGASATADFTQTVGASSATWLAPDYGSTAADNALEVVMRSASSSVNPAKPTFTMKVEQGVRYKLQLLFGETGTASPWRGFDVLVDGKVVVPNLIPGVYVERQGAFGTQKNKVGVVLTHEFTAGSTQLKVELDGAGADSRDILTRDPALSAMTLERLDSATLPPELVVEEGAYVVREVREQQAGVPRSFPLRLIIHDDGTNSHLLQRVFVGLDLTTNTIVATQQRFLDPTQLASARRVSSAQLPWTAANAPWALSKDGTTLVATVNTPYEAVGSNPFLHQYHPDHDNLNAAFSAALPKGQESYGITRTVRLTPAAGGLDFDSITSGQSQKFGVYEEMVVLEGSGSNTRTFRAFGTYSLTRISPVSRLTRN